MPMIDVYAAADLFPDGSDRQVAEALTLALFRAEGVAIPTQYHLDPSGQKQLVTDATDIVAKIAGDPTQAARTWVLVTEAAEGGWGIAGTAFGREEFVAALARSRG